MAVGPSYLQVQDVATSHVQSQIAVSRPVFSAARTEKLEVLAGVWSGSEKGTRAQVKTGSGGVDGGRQDFRVSGSDPI